MDSVRDHIAAGHMDSSMDGGDIASDLALIRTLITPVKIVSGGLHVAICGTFKVEFPTDVT